MLPSSSEIIERCRALGFARAGICRAEPSAWSAQLMSWLDAGRHGEMEYLRRNVELRIDPAVMVPGARSIICVADRYSDGRPDPPLGAGHARIARYARGDDYHVVIKRRLHALADELARTFPGETFRACVDTAPVLEREHAQRAGLGAVGKHTLLIERGAGSYLLLGEVITTLELEPTAPAEPDPCGSCTRCIDACPTDAITPWSVDATRCISYLTIEHRGPIDRAFHVPMGEWIFGCDICQEVCPHNQPTARSRAAAVAPGYAERRQSFDLLEVLGWSEDDRQGTFTRSAMKRAKLAMMKRNALIAAGNALASHELPALRGRVAEIARDHGEDEMVRRTAGEVAGRGRSDCGG